MERKRQQKISLINILILIFIFYPLSMTTTTVAKKTYKEMISGAVFNVSMYNFPPGITIRRDNVGNYTYEGLIVEFLQIMSHLLNCSYRYVHVDKSEVAKYSLIVALLNQLDRKEVDLVPYFFEMVPDNLQHMDLMLYPVYVGQVTLLQPWPAEESRLKVVMRPFQTLVWISFFTSTLAFIGVTSVLIYFQADRRPSLRSLVYYQVEYVITVITSQGNQVGYRTQNSFRVLVSAWLLVMVVIINAYTGVLTSLLAVPKYEPIVDSVEELVKRGDFRLTIEKKVMLTKDFLDATSGYKKDIGDSFRTDPSLLFSDVLQMIDNVLHRRCAYLGSAEASMFAIAEDYKANKICRMTTSSKLMDIVMPYVFAWAKNHPMTPDMTQFFAMQSAAGGITEYLRRKYFPVTNHCQAHAPTKTKVQTVKLLHLTVSFVILAIGICLSILAFFIEKTKIIAKIGFDIM